MQIGSNIKNGILLNNSVFEKSFFTFSLVYSVHLCNAARLILPALQVIKFCIDVHE